METMRQTGGFLAPSHKQDRVFTHSSRLYSTGPQPHPSVYASQQPSGRRRSVGPPQYNRRPMDDYGHYGGAGGAGGSNQYYMAATTAQQRYGGGYQQQQQSQQQQMRQPPRYRRLPPRRRVYSQGTDYNNNINNNPNNANRMKQMRQQAPMTQPMRRYMCDFCHVEFDSVQARSRHTRRAHPRNRWSSMNEGGGVDQSNKTQSAASQTNQGVAHAMQQGNNNNRRGGRMQQQQDKKRVFVCQHCRGVFGSAKSITVHMKERHPSGCAADALQPPASPGNADTSFVNADVKLHECPFCPFAFMSAGELARHRARCRGSQQFSLNMRLVHPGNEGFLVSCPLCRAMVNLSHGFKRHFDNVHPFALVAVQYECALCQKLFDGSELPSQPDQPQQPEAEPKELAEGEEPEEKKMDDPIHRALEAVKAHMLDSHSEEELVELKKQRASLFADQSLKAYERFQRRQGRRRFSGRTRKSTSGNGATSGQSSNEIKTVMGDMLNEIQALDISDKSPKEEEPQVEEAVPPTPAAPQQQQ